MAVNATINFLANMQEFPVFYAPHEELNNIQLEAHEVEITDYRNAPQAPTLEEEGFMLARNDFDLQGEHDPAAVAKIYFPVLLPLIQEITGAAKVMPTPPLLRWTTDPGFERHSNSKPGRFAHSDFHIDSFYGRAHRMLADDPDKSYWLSGRILALNVWRVLSQPPQDIPLAVMDKRSQRAEDAIMAISCIDNPAGRMAFDSTLWKHHKDQRWGYFSNMTPDEALIFKSYDSLDDKAPGPGHSAFDDPTYADNAVPRSSLETRVYCFWGNE